MASAGPQARRPQLQIRGAQSSSSILVNSCQRGNPMLPHIKGVAWEYADIVPDYQVGLSSGVLFLSLKYHRLHPEYIYTRIQKLAHMYTLRVLLVLCDVSDHQPAIRELTKAAVIHRLVIMVAWSAEEGARYLETYKAFEQKPPDLIRARVGEDPMSILQSVLTQVRGINKADVLTLATRYHSFYDMVRQTPEQLLVLPGMGDRKARSLAQAFREPFRADGAKNERKPPEASWEDALPDHFESLPEEEQLRIAMQLSMESS